MIALARRWLRLTEAKELLGDGMLVTRYVRLQADGKLTPAFLDSLDGMSRESLEATPEREAPIKLGGLDSMFGK